MRELTFRTWNSNTGKFYYIHLTEIVGLERTIQIPQNSIIEQYTGCKDSTGKEIYEGDIIKYKDMIGFIEFICGMFVCSWNAQPEVELAYMMIGDLNVIGNIHENKDLLK